MQSGNLDLAAIGRLKKLYAELPGIQCKGLCVESCTAIGYSSVEADLIQLAGQDLPKLREGRCSALTPKGRCGVYSNRPLVCRLFGLVEEMRCPHGCIPEQFLTEEEQLNLFRQVGAGELTSLKDLNLPPELEKLFNAIIAAGRAARDQPNQTQN